MNLQDKIYTRKSYRSYNNNPIKEETILKISNFLKTATPLFKDIKVDFEILDFNRISYPPLFKSPKVVVFYSEKKQDYLQNAGFILQQLDLFLQSNGLASCYLGLAKPKGSKQKNGLSYVISMAFGFSDETERTSTKQFKRKPLEEICNIKDEKLECARLAPSAINSQPWYFEKKDDTYNLYCKKHILNKNLEYMNSIDLGIALSHIYLENKNTFCFYKNQNIKCGFKYFGSFKI